MPSKQSSKRKCTDVIQFGRKNNLTKKSVGIRRIREKTQMSKHPADVNKADDAQQYVLQLAACAIAQDSNKQDQCDNENRHGHEKAIELAPGPSPRGGGIKAAMPTVTMPA